MKITLKNIKHAAFNSQETNCFEATLYVDEVKTCKVRNDGHGGPDFYDPIPGGVERPWERVKEIDAVLNQTMLKTDWGTDLPNCLEIEVAERVNEYLEMKEYKKWCRKESLFRLPGDEDGSWRVIAHPYSDKVKQSIMSKYPTAEILNEKIS